MMNGLDAAFERDLELKLASLTKKMSVLENRIQKVMLEALKNPKKSTAYWNSVRRELDVLYKEIQLTFADWASKNIPARYFKSLSELNALVKNTKNVTSQASIALDGLRNTQYSTSVGRILYEDALASFTSALNAGKNNMYRLTRLTQQKLLDESFIDLSIASVGEGGSIALAIENITSELERRLLEALGNNQFIQAGSRKFTVRYYAELLARTKFHEAQSQACLATCKNYSTDLVLISSHNTTTKICLDFEGKVFSISGTDPRFAPLDLYPPFHPNCLHLMYPQFESALEAQGSLEKASAFSLGESDIPHLSEGWVPISERGVA